MKPSTHLAHSPPAALPGRFSFLSGWPSNRLSGGPFALLFFLLTGALFTWPLVTRLSDSLPDWGDAADSAWRLGVIARQLGAGSLRLYDSNAFYPLDHDLALNELMTGQGLLAAPVIWLTGNLPLAYNLLLYSSFVLGGLAVWLLVRHLTGSAGAGLVAGMIFNFSPAHYGQYGHLGPSAPHWMVFSLYFLVRFLEAGRAGGRAMLYLAGFGLCFVMQAIVAGYYAYFAAIMAGLYLFHYVLWGSPSGLYYRLRSRTGQTDPPEPGGGRRLAKQLGLVALAGGAALLLILPFVWPFVQAKNAYQFERDLREVSYWSAAPTSLLRTTERSWLYQPVQRGVFGLQTSAERMMYPGLVAVGLAVYGLLKRPAARPGCLRGQRGYFGLLALAGLLLSFGPALNLDAYGLQPTGLTLPYRWLYGLVPGFDALRVPQRFGLLFMLGLAALAGYGTARLVRSSRLAQFFGWLAARSRPVKEPVRPGGALVIVILAGLVTLDFFAPGLPVQTTPTGQAAPPTYRWLASSEASSIIPKDALLLELPMTTDSTPVTTRPYYLMYGLSHGRPMLNGSANILPPGYARLVQEMYSFPAPASLDIIEGLGVKYLVVHKADLPSDANRAELERQAGPGGRLEQLTSFDYNLDGTAFRDGVYRVKQGGSSLAAFKELIPAGARALLAERPDRPRLHMTALAGLVGPDRSYFSPVSTIYDNLNGVSIRPAAPGQSYDYGIFYAGDSAGPSVYGFEPAELVGGLPDSVSTAFRVYRKGK